MKIRRKESARNSAGRFLQSASGAAIVEHVVVVAVIVCGVSACTVVGVEANRLFGATAQLMAWITNSDGMPYAMAVSAQAPAFKDEPPSDHPLTAQSEASLTRAGVVWVALGAAIAMASIVVLRAVRPFMYLLRGKSSSSFAIDDLSTSQMLDQLLNKRQQIRRLLARGLSNPAQVEPQVQQLMSTQIVTISPHAKASEAAAIMAERRIHHLLVCCRRGELLGVVSDRDIKERRGKIVDAIMTRDPITVPPETPVAPAITLMIRKGFSCLPVVSREGELRGILTTTDLMLSLQCTLQVLASVASGVSLPSDALQPGGPESPHQTLAAL